MNHDDNLLSKEDNELIDKLTRVDSSTPPPDYYTYDKDDVIKNLLDKNEEQSQSFHQENITRQDEESYNDIKNRNRR